MHWIRALAPFGVAAQLGAVAAIAALAPRDAGLLAALALLVCVPIARRLRPPGARALAMLGWSGLGMTLGWWADLGFRSASDAALQTGAGLDALWCRGAAAGWPAVPGVGHLLSWMNAGMLAFGIPCVVLHPRPAAQLRCGIGMLLGMSAGSWLAAGVATGLDPSHAALVHYACMSIGMLAGMRALEVRAPSNRAGRPRRVLRSTG